MIAGDGAATGRGVITHELGLPGYLARAVSARTGRAADVDIVVSGEMTAAKCLRAIAGLELSRFDAVLISVGTVEAVAFTSAAVWKQELAELLDRIDTDAAPATHTYMLSIPYFAPRHRLPPFLARATDRRVRVLNHATHEVLADRRDVRFIIVGHTTWHEASGAHTYEVWAESVAPHLAEQLAPHGDEKPYPRLEKLHEAARQAAVDRLGAVSRDGDTVLDELTSRARAVFGTAFAGVTLIDNDEQTAASTAGQFNFRVPRDESFCEMTIRRAEHFAVEDASLDPRYKHFGSVVSAPRLRFYAGYPIESADGQRVGALCIIDTKPREFTVDDSTLLRLLAQQAQRRMWELSAAPGAD
ncbi:GAF domain-containing protein [Marisediminicola senii]|uniref:GAF domain-containing protein n=1 Tax=Marisediminicola senii TaxID=2711233 RepID=UPI0013EE2E67|nr:GAF domain-containing protein [Marisediminicola senii]